MDSGMVLIIIGAFMEPVWVVALKKFNEDHGIPWLAVTVVFCVLSPAMMGFGMQTVPMGIAYAVWTGIGAVCTMAVGYFLYKDSITTVKLACVGLILAGVIGLQLFGGASA